MEFYVSDVTPYTLAGVLTLDWTVVSGPHKTADEALAALIAERQKAGHPGFCITVVEED